MSVLEDLIKKHCPNGVEYVPLWSITIWDKKFNSVDKKKQSNTIKYKYYLADELKQLIVPNGNVKILTTNCSDLFTVEELVNDTLTDGEVVCIPWGGNPIVQYYKGKFITSDNRIATSIDINKLDNKFLYYVLINKLDLISSFYRGAGIKHPDMSRVLDINIPLPPIEVQKEIVRILDAFTEYQNCLNEELTLRKKQYEYYRDKLLTFGDDVEWKNLSEIAEIGTGSSNTNEEIENGKYPFFVRSQEVRSKNEYEYDETAIITSGDGVGVGKIFHYVEGKYALHQRAYRIHIIDKNVIPKYYFYYMKTTFLSYIEKTSFHSSVTSIRRPMLNNFPVPVPPLEEQERIVKILDRFDALCNDISSGLPAEIEMRKKQYEYYRDKLLTFKEKKK
ncbi:type I restriction endonuclease subunit S [Brachyspira hyodysenteriae]|uniref:restriction endonuclease subunit S n=1 Tax=Brachyspira hyodysenteriae TaxID=159 RepID=UPI0011841C5A|nr:restriction endonuclease subunit S [Brachyspira hyodysenteriae]TVL60041.1 type I restriction endonuclease subunit S [Brachyspira hyodysenteriae]